MDLSIDLNPSPHPSPIRTRACPSSALFGGRSRKHPTSAGEREQAAFAVLPCLNALALRSVTPPQQAASRPRCAGGGRASVRILRKRPGGGSRPPWHRVRGGDILDKLRRSSPVRLRRVTRMPILVSCPRCQARLQFDDALASQPVRCGGCQMVFALPGAPPPASTGAALAFLCGHCKGQLKLAAHFAGQRVRCWAPPPATCSPMRSSPIWVEIRCRR